MNHLPAEIQAVLALLKKKLTRERTCQILELQQFNGEVLYPNTLSDDMQIKSLGNFTI